MIRSSWVSFETFSNKMHNCSIAFVGIINKHGSNFDKECNHILYLWEEGEGDNHADSILVPKI